MSYQPGQRVALARIAEPATDLRIGDEGTILTVDHDQQHVTVAWDQGPARTMRLRGGDELIVIPAADQTLAEPVTSGCRPGITWPDVLGALRTVGTADGSAAAERWRQDALGADITGPATAIAGRILAGIRDNDPAILATLPAATGWATQQTGHQPAGGTRLPGERRRQLEAAYLEGFVDAVIGTIAVACHRILHPTGDDGDLSHLHPDRVTLGSVGVFSGDWNAADGDTGFPLTAGYVGTLLDRWNGWAVFACTRTVAEAIVADLQQDRDARRMAYAAGTPETDLDRKVDEECPRLSWDGDAIVADSAVQTGDPEAIERITPRPDGRYVVMGWSWCWEAVDPYDCARIVGDLPEPGREQEWVLLTHVPYTVVAPDPYTAGNRHTPGPDLGYTAELRLGGVPVAAITAAPVPAAAATARLTAVTGRFDAARWQAYVAGARRCGEPMTESGVLDALIQEAELGAEAASIAPTGDTLVRLLDDTGAIREVRRVSPAPAGAQDYAALRGRLAAVGAGGWVWQIFNGRGWRHLTNATSNPQAAAGDPDPGAAS
ncbi:DUF4314 domain-containing protein [Dactylosporangium sp. NPDC000244]|uniref:DUF4314 domain-containing protein n=1 Tax=Dactylosporangium sp. NPDC000244 TaxID=3154365 RepID=UPI00331E6D4B